MVPTRSSLSVSIHPDAVTALLPEFEGAAFCEINLDEEALRWRGQCPDLFAAGANPLLDPAVCQRFLDGVHARLGVVWSYGGYLENRPHILQGSYLEQTGGFVHLGVDFNVRQGSLVAAPLPGTVILVDDDHDRDGGWGPRVFLKLEGDPLDNHVLIFAHLQGIKVQPGTRLSQGSVFAQVGGPPDNGNWIPHLHLQAIHADKFFEVLVEKFAELDGYGSLARLEDLQLSFPDPLPIIGWR